MPINGKILYGETYETNLFKVDVYLNEVRNIVENIKNLSVPEKEPKFTMSDYCRSCTFCKTNAAEKDELSLLRGMSTKEIQKWNSKGIFTVTQLSYTFRPRKRNKRMSRYKQKHLFELKALAIREKKTFIYEKPQLPTNNVQIYVDIEGYEDNTSHYLIGLIVVADSLQKHYSFWADSRYEEERIVKQFIGICYEYENYTLFHYGSYEKRYFQLIKKKFPKAYDEQIDKILNNSLNILSIIYTYIYFPTYSNELKDIANHMGFNWTDENASGKQSLVWRSRWEMSQKDDFKQKLITYNMEDCLALQQITDFIYKIVYTEDIVPPQLEKSELMWTKDIQSETSYRLSKPKFFFSNFDVINKCAYFEYQRDKIFFRTNKNVKKITTARARNIKANYKPNKIVQFRRSAKCRYCGSTSLWRTGSSEKRVIDLKYFKGGVKKWIIQYKTSRYTCRKCSKSYTSKAFTKITDKYGHGLMSWIVYHIIEDGTSRDSLRRNLFDIFGFSFSSGTLSYFKTYAAEYYQFTYQKLLKKVVKGRIIHSDETKVKLTTKEGYVWILTNMEVVVFLYKNSREGEFLKDLLKNFQGVLISDFYAGYDSLNSPQQKCLIHLIRDLNHDQFKNPFDEEFKGLVEQFGILLRKIIDTIDKYGLKKRHLNKHKEDVKKYYFFLKKRKYTSELAGKYRSRFEKNKGKLFTFLNYDGVPWNNNNAEHAIKHFAVYRRKVDGLITERGINEYLILLSIYQTCKYRNINFLQFLLSGKKDIDRYKH